MRARIVIVGGGVGGLEAAFSLRSLLPSSAEITLINRLERHSFIPSIHLIVSGKITPAQISIPLNVVLGAAGIRFIRDEALSVDVAAKEVVLAGGRQEYDYLILSSGAANNFFDIPGAEGFSCRFRTPEDAERIREKLLNLLARGSEPCRIVLAGAGTEGVEVIGEVLDLIREQGLGEELTSGRITIELIEGKSRLLPAFPLAVQKRVEEYLLLQGVRLIAGDRIREVRNERVVLSSGEQHEASILIWSGGIQPSKLIRDLPFDKDPWGWLKVNEFLQVPADGRILGIGDAVSVYTDDGPLALQRLAYHAQDQARVAALNVAAAVSGSKPVRYEPKNRPQLISIGKEMGIFTLEDRVSAGAWVVTLKKALERKHLLTYLSKPLFSAIWSRVPGAGMLQRIRTRLPV